MRVQGRYHRWLRGGGCVAIAAGRGMACLARAPRPARPPQPLAFAPHAQMTGTTTVHRDGTIEMAHGPEDDGMDYAAVTVKAAGSAGQGGEVRTLQWRRPRGAVPRLVPGSAATLGGAPAPLPPALAPAHFHLPCAPSTPGALPVQRQAARREGPGRQHEGQVRAGRPLGARPGAGASAGSSDRDPLPSPSPSGRPAPPGAGRFCAPGAPRLRQPPAVALLPPAPPAAA